MSTINFYYYLHDHDHGIRRRLHTSAMVQFPHNQARLYHICGELNGLCACFGLISWDEHLEGHRPSTSTPSPSSCFSAMLATTLWKSITIPTMASIIYKSYQCRHINLCDVIDWWEIFIGGKYEYEEESGEHITKLDTHYNTTIQFICLGPSSRQHGSLQTNPKDFCPFFSVESPWDEHVVVYLLGLPNCCTLYAAHHVVGVDGVSGDLHHH